MFNDRSGRGLLGIRLGLQDDFQRFRGDDNGGPALPTGLLGIRLPSPPVDNDPSGPNAGINSAMDTSRLLALMFPPLPTGNPSPYPSPPSVNKDIQPVKAPLRCSGPNSSCELPLKKRANGIFRDPEFPPFRLCPQCFEKSQKRPGMGDDTRLDRPDITTADTTLSAVRR